MVLERWLLKKWQPFGAISSFGRPQASKSLLLRAACPNIMAAPDASPHRQLRRVWKGLMGNSSNQMDAPLDVWECARLFLHWSTSVKRRVLGAAAAGWVEWLRVHHHHQWSRRSKSKSSGIYNARGCFFCPPQTALAHAFTKRSFFHVSSSSTATQHHHALFNRVQSGDYNVRRARKRWLIINGHMTWRRKHMSAGGRRL